MQRPPALVARPHTGAARICKALLAAGALSVFLANTAAADCAVSPFNYPLGRSAAFYKPSFPQRAKDFAVIFKDGYYHAIYIRNDRNLAGDAAGNEIDFGHAKSADFLNWTELANVNPDGGYTNGVPDHFAWDSAHVWAPQIILVGGVYYMFFTGVNASGQSLGVSTSTDLSTWTPYGSNPVYTVSQIPWAEHPGSGTALRDPFVMRDVVARDGSGVAGWLMYFTTHVTDNGITKQTIGIAWASYSNLYSWHDLGEITSTRSGHSESAHVIAHNGTYYLFVSVELADAGLQYRTSDNPTASTWSAAVKLNDTTQAGGFQQNWFASETISGGATDYLLFIHDYDPPVTGDPICDPHRSPDTIETKILHWNTGATGFTLNDLDFVAPAAITDLVAGVGVNTAALSWTAPGDDGGVGTADHYDVRRSNGVITEANWFSAFQEFGIGTPGVAGSPECMVIQQLDPCTNYYFAVRAVDEAGNYGAISNVPMSKTKCSGSLQVTCENTDITPPGTISLNMSAGCYDHVYLSWIAPGDDGASGTATAYDLRWSSSTITNGNFTSATPIATGAPLPAGNEEDLTVYVPYCSATRYYAIKARDEVNNWSALSNVGSGKPACPHPPIQCFEKARPGGPGAPGDAAALPTTAMLTSPTPNPASDEPTQVQFAIPASLAGANYNLAVFDIAGRQVAKLADGTAEAGNHTVSWDLRSQSGQRVATGIYLVRLRIGTTTLTQRVVTLH